MRKYLYTNNENLVGCWSVKIKTPWYGVSGPKTFCCNLSCDWLTRKKLRLNPTANWGALASDKANQTTTYQYAHRRSNKALCKFTQKPDGCKETAELSRPWHGLLPKIYFTLEWHLALALPLMTFKILSWLFFLASHDTHDKNKSAWRTEIYIYIHLQAVKIDICRITGPATWLQALVWLLQFYWLVDTILSIQLYLDPGLAVRVIWLMCMSSVSWGFLQAQCNGCGMAGV